MIGILQSSLENFWLTIKFPTINQFTFTGKIIKSNLLKKVSFAYETPGIWIISSIKIVLTGITLINAIQGNVDTYLVGSILLIDLLIFPRVRYFPISEVPLQRVVIVAILVHTYFRVELVSNITLVFIVAQVLLAYFAAGFNKLKDSSWLSGESIYLFIKKKRMTGEEQTTPWKLFSNGIMLFELSFFLSLLGGNFAAVYLIMGFAFHLVLSLRDGYNFFLWTFLSTYPAVFYISNFIERLIEGIN